MTQYDTISHSSWQEYEQCPQRWYFHRVEKVPEAPRHYFAFGHTVHAALEEFVRPQLQRPDPPPPMPLEELLAKYDSAWERGGYETPTQEYEYYHKGRIILTQFHAKFLVDRPTPIMVEQELVIPLDGFKVKGIVDRIDLVNGERLHVLDYKTTKRLSQADADKSDQLTIYQILAEKTYSLPVGQMSLYHLLTQEELVTPPRTPEVQHVVVQRLAEAVDGIRADRFEPHKGSWCGRCEYKGICPAWKP